MVAVPNRRTGITLYSGSSDPESHRVRIVLAEKNLTAEIVTVGDRTRLPEDLIDLNPYQSLPTLVDRELALFNSRIIMEYLDERFPHPPLLPIDPVSRARTKLFFYRVEQDWYSLLNDIESGEECRASVGRKQLRESLLAVMPIFQQKPYFMSEEFNMVDCAVAPLLWRLKSYRIDLPPHAKALHQYAERLFARRTFEQSLTDSEREMR